MKLSAVICISLLFSTAAFAMQSPDSANHDRCFYQYKDNPVGQ